jgi:hypothetical protein
VADALSNAAACGHTSAAAAGGRELAAVDGPGMVGSGGGSDRTSASVTAL